MEKNNNWEVEETSYNEGNDAIGENINEVPKKKNTIDIKKITIIIAAVIVIGFGVVYFINQKNNETITLTLITENIQLKVGETSKIKYEISNKNVDVKFSSSDMMIAKVNTDGEIEALSEGKAYIFVSYNYKGNTQGKICSIEILDEGETEKGVDGPPSCSLNVFSNGKIIATPVNATKYGYSETYKNGNEIEYQFTSEKVVGVTKFDILPITYYVENSKGEKTTCSVVIEMTCTDMLSNCTFKGI